MTKLSLPPLALYIHIPWCEKKCPYCDFNSHVSTHIPEKDYIDALLRDIESELPYVQGRDIESIFIGGGTPSLFKASSIERLLNGLQQHLTFSANIEITMEANPSSSEQEQFYGLKQAGVNRLSIGVQSFHDQQLRALGRVHCAEEAHQAIQAAQTAGFERINVDIMHGLPQQTVEAALEDLRLAIASGVSHISWYQLTIEKNTAFFRNPPTLPVEDILANTQDLGMELLMQSGFNQYEVSAFSKPGQEARHNLNYWRFGDYLAIGAGAHGKITLAEQGYIIRYSKTRVPKDYLARTHDFLAKAPEPLAENDILFEYLMNGLRLVEGTTIKNFEQSTGFTAEQLKTYCQPMFKRDLLTIDDKIATTELGFRYLNSALELLIEL